MEDNETSSDKKVGNLFQALKSLSVKYGSRLAFSTSFGLEDQVITDIIFKNDLPVTIFTLDTGRLFHETFDVFNKTIKKYGRNIIVFFPDYNNVESMVNKKGPFSFYQSIEDRKECCYIRKVEPLKRALKGMECWITGLRREQSEERKNLKIEEWDEQKKIIKYYPLIDWSFEDVKKYINEFNVPYNLLHDKGFLSIGCAPCTRAVKENESFRSGRWWWENFRQERMRVAFS